MSQNDPIIQTTFTALQPADKTLRRLDDAFQRLTDALAVVRDAAAVATSTVDMTDPSGRFVVIEGDRPWSTVWVFDRHPDEPAAARQLRTTVGFYRLWRPPTDLLPPEDRAWLRRFAPEAGSDPEHPPETVLPQRWEPKSGWREPTPAELRDLSNALRWACYALSAGGARAA